MLFVFSMLVQLYLAAKKTINLELFRGCLVFKKPSLITPHSITHHLSLKIPQLLKVACLAFVSNFDNSFCGTHGLTWCSFYFFFPSFLSFSHWVSRFAFFFFFFSLGSVSLSIGAGLKGKKEKEIRSKSCTKSIRGSHKK